MPGRHRDLCGTCNHNPGCTYRATTDRPLFYCMEFDTYAPVSRASLGNVSRIASDGERNTDKYRGLCSDCEDRETCTIRGLEEGVWHCEEYR